MTTWWCMLPLAACSPPEPESPEEAVEALLAALAEEDYGAVYDLLSIETQLHLDDALKGAAKRLPEQPEDELARAAGDERTPEELQALSGRELFVHLATGQSANKRVPFVPGHADEQGEEVEPQAVLVAGPRLKAEGNRAHATVRLAEGEEYELSLVREEGRWAVDATAYCGMTSSRPGTAPPFLAVILLLLALVAARRHQREEVNPKVVEGEGRASLPVRPSWTI